MVQGANDIIQPQANVFFQIVQHVDGGKATSVKSVKFASKLDAVVSDKIFNELPKYINPAADFNVFFVWAFQGSKEGSDDLAGTDYIGGTGSVYSKTAFHTGRKLRCWLMKRCTICYTPMGPPLIIIKTNVLVT
jgi:hypothetical protein